MGTGRDEVALPMLSGSSADEHAEVASSASEAALVIAPGLPRGGRRVGAAG